MTGGCTALFRKQGEDRRSDAVHRDGSGPALLLVRAWAKIGIARVYPIRIEAHAVRVQYLQCRVVLHAFRQHVIEFVRFLWLLPMKDQQSFQYLLRGLLRMEAVRVPGDARCREACFDNEEVAIGFFQPRAIRADTEGLWRSPRRFRDGHTTPSPHARRHRG